MPTIIDDAEAIRLRRRIAVSKEKIDELQGERIPDKRKIGVLRNQIEEDETALSVRDTALTALTVAALANGADPGSTDKVAAMVDLTAMPDPRHRAAFRAAAEDVTRQVLTDHRHLTSVGAGRFTAPYGPAVKRLFQPRLATTEYREAVADQLLATGRYEF
jgi:hypothetical protein